MTGSVIKNMVFIQPRKPLLWLAGLSLCFVLTGAVQAQEGDLPGLQRYPNASLYQSVTREARNYPVLGSRARKIRGEIRADKEQWLDGFLERRVYEIPTGHGSARAFQDMTKHIKALGAEVEFLCEGRDCGPSNLWANDIFGVSTLYGHDREQHYLLASREVKGSKEYYVLYSITRGTRRVYTMIDQFTVPAP
ncbi:DUF4892 domain-containing protein [Sansalvadorimonas verongulae]|uniref:DUF4892 domain-containing protein n=1 Tax=Sansalvadorimonas verongulae TaxID=2172824 RepID=UPI0012BB79E2|nr:DUF4892 domain-containing protein [Sansalvadorimonas verongulae]MTI13916.1 DUF4892 domain-containing protein [Sansalvadorimonas verongulae]